MTFMVVGSHSVAHVAPGGEVTEQQIAAAGGSVSHLIASGHIAPVVKASKKATSTIIPVDEAENEETE
jgi:poly(3-hydroxyalkanoate) synthetase